MGLTCANGDSACCFNWEEEEHVGSMERTESWKENRVLYSCKVRMPKLVKESATI